ncbi:MAG: hypothetical protein ACLPGW_17430 [Roseiarcus sp.]
MAKATARAGSDAAVTIAARTRGLLIPGFDLSGEKAREAQRMVHEKLSAAVEGAFAAQIAWGSFLVSAAFGGVRTVEDAAHGLADVAEAALAPAHRTVRANARRLTGGRALG